MIRTRHAVGVGITALLALPFVATTAEAAPGTAVAGGDVHAGETLTVDVTVGDETGAYAVDIVDSGDVVVDNNISTGTDITALDTVTFAVPRDHATGTDFHVVIDPTGGGTWDPIESDNFDILAKHWAITVPAVVRGGNDLVGTVLSGSETGSYVVDLVDADNVALLEDVIPAGADIADIPATITKAINRGQYTGTGRKLRLTVTDNGDDTVLYSNSFAITKGATQFTTSASPAAGAAMTITVDKGDETGAYVVELLKGTDVVDEITTGASWQGIGSTISYTPPVNDPTVVGATMKIRLRHGVGSTFTTVDSSTFTIAQAGAAVSVTGPLQLGDTETINLVDGVETGKYKINLYKGDTKIATLKSGDTIEDVGGKVKWTLPTGNKTLVAGDTYKIKVEAVAPAAWTTYVSSTFAIEASKIATVTGQGSAWAQGETREIHWTKSGATGSLVDIALVKDTKATVIVKGTSNDGVEDITIPLSLATGAGYKVRVTPQSKTATFGESSAVEITTADEAFAEPDDDTLYRGQTSTAFVSVPEGLTAKVDLVLKSAPTKSLLAIAKAAVDNDEIEFTVPAKLALGEYALLATVNGTKPAVTTLTDVDLVAATSPEIVQDTLDTLAEGVVTGQTVAIGWESDSDGPVTVTLKGGAKPVVIDGKATTVNGVGVVYWLVDAKQAAGTTYTIEVASTIDTASKDTSANFAVAANPMVFGA